MRKSTAMSHPLSSSDSASTPEAVTPDTDPQLIALAVSLAGSESKVMEQIGCSQADFLLYRSGAKELPVPELDRLVSMIIEAQGSAIAMHREALKAIRGRRS